MRVSTPGMAYSIEVIPKQKSHAYQTTPPNIRQTGLAFACHDCNGIISNQENYLCTF